MTTQFDALWVPKSGEDFEPFEKRLTQTLMSFASRSVLSEYREAYFKRLGCGSLLELLDEAWEPLQDLGARLGLDVPPRNAADRKWDSTVVLHYVNRLSFTSVILWQAAEAGQTLGACSDFEFRRTLLRAVSRDVLSRARAELLELAGAKGAVYQDSAGVESCMAHGFAGLYHNLLRKVDRIRKVSTRADAQAIEREAAADRTADAETLAVTLRDLCVYTIHTLRWLHAAPLHSSVGTAPMTAGVVDQLRDLEETFRNTGVCSLSPYGLGLTNGVRLALAVVTDAREVELLDPPAEWLSDDRMEGGSGLLPREPKPGGSAG